MASFIVGTFNTPELFHLSFDANNHSLHLIEVWPAHGNHSWLALDKDRQRLYATAWTEPTSVASYSLTSSDNNTNSSSIGLTLLNTAPTRARSGYVAVGKRPSNVLYTVGGPTGEVIRLNNKGDGGFPSGPEVTATLQNLDFVKGYVSTPEEDAAPSNGQHLESNGKVMDFGGLRHGSHSIDLSPDGSIAYVADIGRNCIWVYQVSPHDGSLSLSQKCVSPRSNDGPRHVWPHPNGKVAYVLQEHSCIVDVFEVRETEQAKPIPASSDVGPQSMKVEMIWKQGVRIIPTDLSPTLFWADEVRLSPGSQPHHLLASTRGLEPKTKGYVGLFELDEEGYISELSRKEAVKEEGEVRWLDLWQTPTSGGWANAIEPCYKLLKGNDGMESTYAALTDSEQGLVIVLQVKDDKSIEVARVNLGETQGKIRGAATAVWL